MRVPLALRPIAVCLCLLLAACTGLQLVDRYDVAIEDGVNKYHKDVTKFLKEDVNYTSPAAKEFYSTAAANLANVIVRAQVVATSATCVDSKVTDTIATQVRNGVVAAGGSIANLPTADISLQSGSCTVVALKALAANHARLEGMHKRLGRLGAYRSALWAELLGDSVRIALTIEAAKKP